MGDVMSHGYSYFASRSSPLEGGIMQVSISTPQSTLDERKAWSEPAIVLERSLLVSAQGPNPGGPNFGPPQQGFIGPLNTSGNSGHCV